MNIKDLYKKEKALFILIIIVILTIIGLGIIKLTRTLSDNNRSKRIQELQNTFVVEPMDACGGLINYSDKKVTVNDLTINNKLCIAYNKTELKEVEKKEYEPTNEDKTLCKVDDMVFRINNETKKCEVSIYDAKLINNTASNMFGNDKYDLDSFRTSGTTICFKNADKYYCGLSEIYTYILGANTEVYRIIDSYEEKGSSITITDHFIKINNNKCYSNYTTDTINEKCNSAYYDENSITEDFITEYGTKYKHTYKKNLNKTYSWVSSELINE